MIDHLPKIVVITPVKNEAWILDRFLSVTSQFADHIIIADQNSVDDSVAICKNYPKVMLIENNSTTFNEAERQQLLIKAARDLIVGHKIILALDADEILAANATQTCGWQTMLKANPGTVLCFERPDLYPTPDLCVESFSGPLGYVDDGIEHLPKKIHSTRIPTPNYGYRLHLYDIKFLHYGSIRESARISKYRFYSALENSFKTTNLLLRRARYNPSSSWPPKQQQINPSRNEWFNQWEETGIDMKSIYCSRFYWYDFEILKLFKEHGVVKFWLDDIWDFDWEACRLHASSQQVEGIPDKPILPPPKMLQRTMKLLDKVYLFARKGLKVSIYRHQFE
jgi:glycosyltransferase involved in cell wall biosynthesis